MCSSDLGGASVTYKHADYEKDTGYADPFRAINFSFPCDFDYLSDLLNGVDERGMNINSLITQNLSILGIQGLGGAANIFQGDCYKGGNVKQSFTNKGSGEDYGCQSDVESHLLKRQARMALLDRDKISLRMVVPWNPLLHVGKVITFNWKNKLDTREDVYGSGDYLITGLSHVIKFGGFSTTAIDCVSKTVGMGEV